MNLINPEIWKAAMIGGLFHFVNFSDRFIYHRNKSVFHINNYVDACDSVVFFLHLQFNTIIKDGII